MHSLGMHCRIVLNRTMRLSFFKRKALSHRLTRQGDTVLDGLELEGLQAIPHHILIDEVGKCYSFDDHVARGALFH